MLIILFFIKFAYISFPVNNYKEEIYANIDIPEKYHVQNINQLNYNKVNKKQNPSKKTGKIDNSKMDNYSINNPINKSKESNEEKINTNDKSINANDYENNENKNTSESNQYIKKENQDNDAVNNIIGKLTEVETKTSVSDIKWNDNKKRRLINKVIPRIPDTLKSLMGEYRIKVYIEVNKFGMVSYIEIIKSSGIPQLDSIVLDAISKWTFEIVSDDNNYSGYVNFTVLFK